jgi:Polyketide cyclase / dehydrase and lipid transport
VPTPRRYSLTYVTDPSRFGEWQSGVISGHIDGEGVPSVGSRCIMTRRIGGSERTSTSETTEILPPRTWTIRGIDGPIRANVHVTVESRQDGEQSHVTIHLDFHGSGIGKMLVPMVVRQARKEVPRSCQNLKKLLENRGPSQGDVASAGPPQHQGQLAGPCRRLSLPAFTFADPPGVHGRSRGTQARTACR